jgi:tetratricopeptide (TPR) repeat protein
MHISSLCPVLPKLQKRLRHGHVPLVKQSGDPLALAELLACEHDRRFGTPAVQERVDIARELLQLAQRAGHHALQLPYLNQLAANLIELGRLDEWETVVDTHRRLAERLKSPQHMALGHRHRCMHALLRGRFVDARACVQQGLALVQHCDPMIAHELMTALAAVEFETVGVTPQVQAQVLTLGALSGLQLWVLQDMGRRDLVRERIGPAAAQFRGSVRTFNSPTIAAALAQAAAYVDDAKLAEELLSWLEGFENLHVVAGVGGIYFGPAARYIGLLKRTLGRWNDSIEMLQESLRLLHAIGSPTWAARVHLDLAEAYLQGGDADSGEQAARHAREGLRIGEELGMSHIERRAQQLRRA